MSYFRFFIVVSLFSLITITSSFSQNDCTSIQGCTDGVCGNCTTWSPASGYAYTFVNIILPDFPTCTLTVFYCYRQCMDNGLCVHFFWDYACEYGNCDALENYCSCPDPETQFECGRHLENEIWEAIANLTWKNFKNGVPSDTWPYCDQTSSTRFKCSGTPMSCRAYCYTQYPTYDPTIHLLITPLSCSSQYCCMRTLSFCVDRATGNTVTNEEWTATPTPMCTDEQPNLNNCPAGMNVSVSNCKNFCVQP